MGFLKNVLEQEGWAGVDWVFWGLMGRMVVINVIPFFLVFHLVMRRRGYGQRQSEGELALISREIQIVGLLGYYVILSIFFFSIPVLQYLNTKPGYDILLIQPDNYTVFIIGFVSFSLVVSSVYMNQKRTWAYHMSLYLIFGLLVYSFFSVLEWGLISGVPVILFAYLLYRLTRASLKVEIKL